MSTAVEQIKGRISILDVVGAYVKLEKAGKQYKGKSPFTNEKTPSFFVSPDRGMYYCFSSGKGGDMFTFIEEMEGVDFRGALKILAERAGVELTPERPEDRTERETLYRILEDATEFFENSLEKNEAARMYLTNRGVTDETRTKWRIGFAPNAWRDLSEYLQNKGHQKALIRKAGLIKESDGAKEPYDVFRNRIMFPISDASGRVVGFSGRDQSGDSTAPKYVNSPETPLYEKSRILFGYDKAKDGIRKLDFSLIVEGQFDLVLSHQAGYTNAVAISGTAMTAAHVEQLERLSKRVVLALDADRAGIASAKRAATLMLAKDMDVKIAHVVGGKDPADLVREDPKLLKSTIGKAEHIIPGLIAILKSEAKDDRVFGLRIRDEVVPFIAIIPNRIDAEHFEGVVAEATGTTKESIHFEVERVREEKNHEQKSEAAHAPKVENKPPAPSAGRRTEDIVSHLYGVLLWLKSSDSMAIAPPTLEKYLETALGTEAFQSLGDWPDESKNKATFEAEHAYVETPDAVGRTVGELLYELRKRVLKTDLAKARATLTGEALTEKIVDLQKELMELEKKNPFILN